MYLEHFDRIVAALAPACAGVYGARLRALALFGSVARGTQRPDSDIDVLLIVDRLPAGRDPRMTEFERVDALLAPLLADARAHGVHTDLSPVLKTPAELAAGSLLYLDMVDQARILVDDGGMLRRFLDDLGARLAAAGARRVRKGSGYYWDLAPDYRWGDRIEL
jgi:predicted nucleotidyltransferase